MKNHFETDQDSGDAGACSGRSPSLAEGRNTAGGRTRIKWETFRNDFST